MKYGYIVWDADIGRPDIKFNDGGCYGGLHCGATFEAFLWNNWLTVRIEYCHTTESWYLVGIDNGYEILWLDVRI